MTEITGGSNVQLTLEDPISWGNPSHGDLVPVVLCGQAIAAKDILLIEDEFFKVEKLQDVDVEEGQENQEGSI